MMNSRKIGSKNITVPLLGSFYPFVYVVLLEGGEPLVEVRRQELGKRCRALLNMQPVKTCTDDTSTGHMQPCPEPCDGSGRLLLAREVLRHACERGYEALELLVDGHPVGSRPGQAGGEHLLLDLERLGCLAVSGDPDAAQDLLRYIASELAMNTWSDDVEVVCAGWPPEEADLLVALNPHRVRAVPGPIAEQVAQLRQRVRVAATTLEGVEAADALAGRTHDLAGDSWMPTVLIANNPQPADIDAIADLASDLAHVGRCAVAVVTGGAVSTREDHEDGAHAVSVTTGRELYVPFLDLTLTAAGLPLRELEPLAKVIATARDGIEEPVPPAPEPEPWAAGTDAAGALLPGADTGPVVDEEQRPSAAAIVEPPVSPPALAAGALAVAAVGRDQADPTLDEDLAAWYRPVADRPRIRVLGPVVDAHEVIDTPGEPPKPGRLLLLAEVLVYLAQRGKRGASPTQLDEDLWPGQDVQVTYRRATISRARQWAGRRDDGTPWLAEVHYRLEPGYLLDWHLFRRLRSRGQSRGPEGADDLRAALELVRGVPLASFERIASTTRSPYNWLPTSNIDPDHLVAAIIDTANELAQLYLAAGDAAGARWAVEKAWQADPDRSYDQPWRTILRVHAHDGHHAELETTVRELMRLREAEVEEDLDPATYALLQEILPAGYWNGSWAREPVRQDHAG
jgi:hypothetical protein